MIAALSLNPALDRLVTVEKFVYGGMNRIIETMEEPSGKGVNVATGVRYLGAESVCAGFVFTRDADKFDARLHAHGVKNALVSCPGAVRVCTKVRDMSTGKSTELNERGTRVDQTHIDKMIESVRALSACASVLVLTGSVPPGCPIDIYRTLITSAPCATILDAEGALFLQGVQAAPTMIKPNLDEMELAAGQRLPDLHSIRAACMPYLEMGVRIAVVSMGGDGALMVMRDGAFFAPAPRIAVRSTVGAGDAMVAGFAVALERGASPEEILRTGTASGAACASADNHTIDPDLFAHLYKQVSVLPQKDA